MSRAETSFPRSEWAPHFRPRRRFHRRAPCPYQIRPFNTSLGAKARPPQSQYSGHTKIGSVHIPRNRFDDPFPESLRGADENVSANGLRVDAARREDASDRFADLVV